MGKDNIGIQVSIIIPVFKAKDFIIDCLKAVSSQTFTGSIECLLIDDCGGDNSIVLAEEYIASCDYNIDFVVLRQEYNQGPSAARNRGIREAKGEYVFFLDADDVISPDCIELLYSLAKQYNLDYVQGMYHSDEHYQMPVYKSEDCNILINDRKVIKKNLLNYTYIPFTPHNRLVRRQFLLEHNLFFPEKIKVREDFYWMFFVAKCVERMALCNKETYFRGYNGESLTHNINKEREILAYRTLIEDFCVNIDPFMKGEQKALILDTLLIAIRGNYFENDISKKKMISIFMQYNVGIEKIMLRLLFLLGEGTLKSKLLHLLLRSYKQKNI